MRDLALRIEKDSAGDALLLYSIASKLRPSGKFIKDRIDYLNGQKENDV